LESLEFRVQGAFRQMQLHLTGVLVHSQAIKATPPYFYQGGVQYRPPPNTNSPNVITRYQTLWYPIGSLVHCQPLQSSFPDLYQGGIRHRVPPDTNPLNAIAPYRRARSRQPFSRICTRGCPKSTPPRYKSTEHYSTHAISFHFTTSLECRFTTSFTSSIDYHPEN